VSAALSDFTTIVERDQDPNPAVFLNRGILRFAAKDFNGALEDFTELARVSNLHHNPIVLHSVGVCLYCKGDLDAALVRLDEAIEIDPHFVDALVVKGDVLLQKADPVSVAAGQRLYQKAVVIAPSRPLPYICLAFSLQSQGRLQDAWTITTGPNSPELLEARAIIAMQGGRCAGLVLFDVHVVRRTRTVPASAPPGILFMLGCERRLLQVRARP
jgi:tetratricopeptide (TPR) repeat protein